MLQIALVAAITAAFCTAGPVSTFAGGTDRPTTVTSTAASTIATGETATSTETALSAQSSIASSAVTTAATSQDTSTPASTSLPKLILKLEEGMVADRFLEQYKPSSGNSSNTAQSDPTNAHLFATQQIAGLELAQAGPADVELPPLVSGNYAAAAAGPEGVAEGAEVEGDLALIFFSVKLPSQHDLQCVIERFDTKAVLGSSRQQGDETFTIRSKDWESVIDIQAANQAYRVAGEQGNKTVKMRCQMVVTRVKQVTYGR